MVSALICTVLGGISATLLGLNLGLSFEEILIAIGASNLGGILALAATQFGARVSWVKRVLLRGGLGTWLVFLTVYFGTELTISEPLRDLRTWAVLVIPLIFSAGLSILFFGPIQDAIVRRSQIQ